MSGSTDDLKLVADSARRVLSAEYGSRVLHRHFDGNEDVEASLWSTCGEMGWLAAILPERVGGLGLGVEAGISLLREFGRAVAPGSLSAGAIAAMLVAMGAKGSGSECAGTALLSGEICPLVPGRSFDGKVALDGGRLSGRFDWMIGGRIANSALVPVEGGAPAFALVVIDGRTAICEAADIWDRSRAVKTLTCEAAEPAAVLEVPREAGDALRTFTRLAIAADSVGLHEASLDATIAYTRDREQFGRPVGSFQALKHRMADMRIGLEITSRLLGAATGYYAAGAADAATWAALAKAQATDASVQAAEEEVLLHGGVGYTWEFDCHIRLKRAKLNVGLGGRTAEVRDDAFEGLLEAAQVRAREAA